MIINGPHQGINVYLHEGKSNYIISHSIIFHRKHKTLFLLESSMFPMVPWICKGPQIATIPVIRENSRSSIIIQHGFACSIVAIELFHGSIHYHWLQLSLTAGIVPRKWRAYMWYPSNNVHPLSSYIIIPCRYPWSSIIIRYHHLMIMITISMFILSSYI